MSSPGGVWTVGARWVHGGWTVGARWVHGGCTVGARWVHGGCTVGARWVHGLQSALGSRRFLSTSKCGWSATNQCLYFLMKWPSLVTMVIDQRTRSRPKCTTTPGRLGLTQRVVLIVSQLQVPCVRRFVLTLARAPSP